jgi:hypothetical protein
VRMCKPTRTLVPRLNNGATIINFPATLQDRLVYTTIPFFIGQEDGIANWHPLKGLSRSFSHRSTKQLIPTMFF